MNSTVGLIFNESFLLKKRFVSPVNSAWDPHKTPNASENAAAGVFKHSLYLINMRKKKSFVFAFITANITSFFHHILDLLVHEFLKNYIYIFIYFCFIVIYLFIYSYLNC